VVVSAKHRNSSAMSHSKSRAESVSAKSRDLVQLATRYLASGAIFGVETRDFASFLKLFKKRRTKRLHLAITTT
jgi:hypothetical protein